MSHLAFLFVKRHLIVAQPMVENNLRILTVAYLKIFWANMVK